MPAESPAASRAQLWRISHRTGANWCVAVLITMAALLMATMLATDNEHIQMTSHGFVVWMVISVVAAYMWLFVPTVMESSRSAVVRVGQAVALAALALSVAMMVGLLTASVGTGAHTTTVGAALMHSIRWPF